MPGNDADSVSTVIVDVPRADLGITVAYSPNVLNNTVRVGDQYSQYFTVRNFGPAAATNVTIIFDDRGRSHSRMPNVTDPVWSLNRSLERESTLLPFAVLETWQMEQLLIASESGSLVSPLVPGMTPRL